MADDLNSLLQANRSSSVLQGIANPQLVNPLAAQNSAVQAAGNVYNLRGLQAQQAWGDALQQATDENGNVDYPKAQAIAARMGAVTQMGMLSNLQGASGLQTSQAANINARMSLSGRAGLSLSVDPSDENLEKVRQDLLANGVPAAQVEANYQRMKAMKPFERQQIAHRLAAGSLEHFTGSPQMQGTGGDFQPYLFRGPQAPGYGSPVPTVTPGGGSIAATMSPADLATVVVQRPATAADVEAARQAGKTLDPGAPITITKSDVVNGGGLSFLLTPAQRAGILQAPVPGAPRPPAVVTNPGGGQVSPTNPARPPVRQLVVPGAPAAPAPVVPAAPAASGGNPFGGLGGSTPAPVVPAPAARPPASGPPSVPITGLAPDGSVQTASANPLEAPEVGAPSPPNPLVPSDVAAIQAGMQRAQDTPRIPGTQTAGSSFVGGAGLEEQGTQKLSAERLEADQRVALDHAKTLFPIAQALSQYGRGVTTAPGAETANQWKGWLGGVARSAGLPGADMLNSSADFDKLNKDLNQVLMANPAARNSDAMLASTMGGSANAHVHELAGADMLKANAALVRMIATARSEWQNMPQEDKAKYNYYYANFLQDFNKTFDPRAGAYDMYNPAQAKTLLDDLRAHDKPYQDRFWNSVDMVKRNGYFGETRAMP